MKIVPTFDQVLAIADARRAAYARDPEKYEEMQQDAKLYPETRDENDE